MAARNLEQEIETLRHSLDDIRAQLGGTAHELAGEGRRQLGRARRAAGHAADRVSTGARSGARLLGEEVEERPFISVGVAFLAGVLIALVLARRDDL